MFRFLGWQRTANEEKLKHCICLVPKQCVHSGFQISFNQDMTTCIGNFPWLHQLYCSSRLSHINYILDKVIYFYSSILLLLPFCFLNDDSKIIIFFLYLLFLHIYFSLLLFQSMASFFINCYCIYACICKHICILICISSKTHSHY